MSGRGVLMRWVDGILLPWRCSRTGGPPGATTVARYEPSPLGGVRIEHMHSTRRSLNVQHGRRRNPYPHTWELPLAVAVGFSLALAVGVHVGRGLANLSTGNGWVFVDRAWLLTSLPGVLSGRADAGLAPMDSPASPALLWLWIALVEVGVLAAGALGLKAGLGRWGSSRIQGTATREEADELLGIGRLRRHAPLIRPDLYVGWRRRRRTRPLHVPNVRTAGIGGDPA